MQGFAVGRHWPCSRAAGIGSPPGHGVDASVGDRPGNDNSGNILGSTVPAVMMNTPLNLNLITGS